MGSSFLCQLFASSNHRKCLLLPHTFFMLLPFFVFSTFHPVNAFWLPPDYWVTIYRNGQIEPGRSQQEFLDFSPSNGAYIGYWINNTQVHHEAYGHVPDPRRSSGSTPQFCGHFSDSLADQSQHICGGFRILAYKRGTKRPCPNPFTFVPSSIADPFLAIEYLDTQIARIQLDNGQWVFGGAKMAERVAFAADPRGGPLIKIPLTKDNASSSPMNRVQILQRSAAFSVEDLLDDSSPRHPPQPLPPIPMEEVPTTATEEEEETRTTTPQVELTTTTTRMESEGEGKESTTALPKKEEEEAGDYDDGLSGAGIEWGALFTGEGVEEMEQQDKVRKRARDVAPKHRRRRRHHFRPTALAHPLPHSAYSKRIY